MRQMTVAEAVSYERRKGFASLRAMRESPFRGPLDQLMRLSAARVYFVKAARIVRCGVAHGYGTSAPAPREVAS